MIFANPVRGPILGPNARPNPPQFRVTQRFGCTGYAGELPYKDCAHFHRGIDLGNSDCGADVLAVEKGVVTLAGKDPLSGYAIRVVIKHPGGWFSLYYHLADELVYPGQSVAKGRLIGHVGTSGWSTACHLHFEVHKDDDRLSFFDPWPHFAQNVTVHPRGAGINIRSEASTSSGIYASTKADGHIHKADGKDLGLTSQPRKWGGTVSGSSYVVGGQSSTKWERMYLNGGYRYLATLLATRSQSL